MVYILIMFLRFVESDLENDFEELPHKSATAVKKEIFDAAQAGIYGNGDGIGDGNGGFGQGDIFHGNSLFLSQICIFLGES